VTRLLSRGHRRHRGAVAAGILRSCGKACQLRAGLRVARPRRRLCGPGLFAGHYPVASPLARLAARRPPSRATFLVSALLGSVRPVLAGEGAHCPRYCAAGEHYPGLGPGGRLLERTRPSLARSCPRLCTICDAQTRKETPPGTSGPSPTRQIGPPLRVVLGHSATARNAGDGAGAGWGGWPGGAGAAPAWVRRPCLWPGGTGAARPCRGAALPLVGPGRKPGLGPGRGGRARGRRALGWHRPARRRAQRVPHQKDTTPL
jgi:hypothetical protein